jgi:hypothetical protein
MLIDEASQPTWSAVFEAWQLEDPPCILFAGDDKQLPPHAKTAKGAEVYADSPLVMAARASPDSFDMLRMQIRMPEWLYWATNWIFYNGEVATWSGVVKRDYHKFILGCVEKISITTSSANKWLSHTWTCLILKEPVRVGRLDGSAFNFDEAEEVIQLSGSFLKPGVNAGRHPPPHAIHHPVQLLDRQGRPPQQRAHSQENRHRSRR